MKLKNTSHLGNKFHGLKFYLVSLAVEESAVQTPSLSCSHPRSPPQNANKFQFWRWRGATEGSVYAAIEGVPNERGWVVALGLNNKRAMDNFSKIKPTYWVELVKRSNGKCSPESTLSPDLSPSSAGPWPLEFFTIFSKIGNPRASSRLKNSCSSTHFFCKELMDMVQINLYRVQNSHP